ncbi:MAG TPA: hypothetical protein VGK00_03275 [Anaerolineales bacterium]|jgi:hypothetical protein
MTVLPEIVKRAYFHTVIDEGQLTAEETKALNEHVKKGYLAKGTRGPRLARKTVYARPGYNFKTTRKHQAEDQPKERAVQLRIKFL